MSSLDSASISTGTASAISISTSTSTSTSTSVSSTFPLRIELYLEALAHWPGSSKQHQTPRDVLTTKTTTTTSTTPADSDSRHGGNKRRASTLIRVSSEKRHVNIDDGMEEEKDNTLVVSPLPTAATSSVAASSISVPTTHNHDDDDADDDAQFKTCDVKQENNKTTTSTSTHASRPTRVILAQYDTNTIIVYQAFHPSIASYAVKHQTFNGCPGYSIGRMTWIKTNFLWMMFRSGWATKSNQQRILAITLARDFFHQLLASTVPSSYQNTYFTSQDEYDATVAEAQASKHGWCRMQWDPDHTPDGCIITTRRAIQLGLKGVTAFTKGKGIVKIDDITQFVQEQHKIVLSGDWSRLYVPCERVYPIADANLAKRIMLDIVEDKKE